MAPTILVPELLGVMLLGPEGTSNTLLLVAGQFSGIIFIFLMDALKAPSESMTEALLGLLVPTLVSVALASFLKESPNSRAAAWGSESWEK